MAKGQRGSLLKKLFLRPHHFVKSLYIADVRKDVSVVVNEKNRVSGALLCVHVIGTVNKYIFWPNSGNY